MSDRIYCSLNDHVGYDRSSMREVEINMSNIRMLKERLLRIGHSYNRHLASFNKLRYLNIDNLRYFIYTIPQEFDPSNFCVAEAIFLHFKTLEFIYAEHNQFCVFVLLVSHGNHLINVSQTLFSLVVFS